MDRAHSSSDVGFKTLAGRLHRLAPGVPLPLQVLFFLGLGFALGLLFPHSRLVEALYRSGTYFPRLIVTLAALLIFHLLAAATAKLVLNHRQRAGRLFLRVVAIYGLMGVVSLIYATVWLGFLSGLPFSPHRASLPTPLGWSQYLAGSLAQMLFQQPLFQVLAAGVFIGWLTATAATLRPAAYAFIAVGDRILNVFRKLLWYYPIMIGCLAIGIPLKFGHRGLAFYGQCVLWDMIVIVVWCVAMVLFCKTVTRRTWKQILSYYGTVWPTGFGTGGSYDTLAVNLISSEKDLGLSREISEISIVFGTVLNKNCATMSVLIVTVIVAKMLGIPLSILEIVLLIPPVAILGFESPGVPGGAGYFMSPVLAGLLHVPDSSLWVATFIAFYSGLIPMFSTAGNTTDDGVVGAILEDCFRDADGPVELAREARVAAPLEGGA